MAILIKYYGVLQGYAGALVFFTYSYTRDLRIISLLILVSSWYSRKGHVAFHHHESDLHGNL
jgi:hypothetical protein